MENAILEYLISGGSSAAVVVLALLIFWAYRKDRKSSEERQRSDRVFMEDRLTKMVESEQATRDENTKAITELTTFLKLRNGRK